MQQGSTNKDCGCHTPTGDGVEANEGRRWFDQDAVGWLVGEGIRHIHAADDKAELGYKRVVELLAGNDAATRTIAQLIHTVTADDVCLRWSLLHLLADVGDARAADVFTHVASEPVEPRERDRRCCESVRDGEVLVRTMAIEGLAKVSAAHKLGVERLFKVLEAQAEPALRVEAVKAILAAEPHAAERLKHMLPESLHFALTLKRARAESLAVEVEAKGMADAVRGMPVLGSARTSPAAQGDCR